MWEYVIQRVRVFLLILLCFRSVAGQQPTAAPTPVPSPNPTTPTGFVQGMSIPVVRLADTSTYKRTDFCPAMSSVATGRLAIWNALSGMVISVGVEAPGQADPAYMTFNTTSGFPTGGYFYSVLNRLAAAGNFKIQWVQMPSKPDSQGLGDYAKQITPAVDIHAGRSITDTDANRLKGLDFSAQITDANQIFVAPQGPNVEDSTWSFAKPFVSDLWGVIIAFSCCHGVIMYLFRESKVEKFQDYIYSSVGKMVGASELNSKHFHIQLLTVSYNFCIFIIIASYTANLATFLIQSTTYVPSIQSIDEANKGNLKICVQSGTASASVLTTYYSDILQVPQPLYAALGLATGQCVGAYMTAADLAITQSRQMLDSTCSFVQVGGVVKQYSGAWALQNDFGCPSQDGKTCRCTSFMNQVLTQLFLTLRSSGTMKSDFDNAIASQTDRVCPADAVNNNTLQISDLRGVFYLYGLCFAICMGFYVCQYHITPVLEKIYLRRMRNDRCDACLGIEVQKLDEAGGGKTQVSGKDYPEDGSSENQMGSGVILQQPTQKIHEEDEGEDWKYIRSGADRVRVRVRG